MPLTELEKKERKRISDKKYRENNREKLREGYKKSYLERKDNPEYKEYLYNKLKNWRKKNPQKYKEQQLTYNGKKNLAISKWRWRGIIDPDFKSVYDYFITQTNCWICDKEYNKVNKMDLRCLDHDHDLTDEPNIRYICCGYCNLHLLK